MANDTGGKGLRDLMVPFGLLAVTLLALALRYGLHLSAPFVFLAGVVAIAVLADWIRRATEQVAEHVGLFVLLDGRADVVRAQITGSIIGASLLGLGLAMVLGGATLQRQSFKRGRAGQLSSLLVSS